MFSKPTTYRFWTLALVFALLAGGLSFSPAAAQTACPNPYTVQRGDTLSGIAVRCGTTLAAMLQANPAVTNPSRIYVGQRLNLPSQTSPTPTPTQPPAQSMGPVVALAQACGLPGSQVKLYGSNMPANSQVELRLGLRGGSSITIATVKTDSKGTFNTMVTIPASSDENDTWVVTARVLSGGGSQQVSSNAFDVVEMTTIETLNSEKYTVKSGDTLRKIANSFNTSVAAILALNPQVTDPNIIYPGQVLRIPGLGDRDVFVLVSPQCGAPGSKLSVTASGFEDGERVTLKLRGVHDNEIDDKVTSTTQVTAGKDGKLSASFEIPAAARANGHWVVTAEVNSEDDLEGVSNLFATSSARSWNEPAAHVVQRGDTLSQIAANYGRRLAEVLGVNPQIDDRNRIYTGQVVVIPPQ